MDLPDQTRHLVVGARHVGDAVVVGGHQSHAVQRAEIAHQRPGQSGPLLGIGTPGELVQRQEEALSTGALEQPVQQMDFPSEGGKPPGAGAGVRQDQSHLVEQGEGGGLGKDEESALTQQQAQHGGAQGDGFAAHIGPGDDGASCGKIQIQPGKVLPPLHEFLGHLGMAQALEGEGGSAGERRPDAAIAFGQFRLGQE